MRPQIGEIITGKRYGGGELSILVTSVYDVGDEATVSGRRLIKKTGKFSKAVYSYRLSNFYAGPERNA